MASRRKLTEEEHAAFNRERRINRRSTLVSFFAIVGFLLVSLPFLMNSPTPLTAMKNADKQRTVPRLSLTAHYYQGEGVALDAFSGEIQSKPLAFTVASVRPLHISIAASINGTDPVVLFHRVRIPPGPQRLIEKAGIPFLYELEESVRSARFCVLDGSDSEKLQQAVNNLKTNWLTMDEALCVQLR